MDLGNGLCIHRNFLRNADFETWNPTFFYQEEDQSCGPFGRCMDSLNYRPDRFSDEMVVTLDTDRGLFLVAGCSHPGIINILTTVEQRTGKKVCGLTNYCEPSFSYTMERFENLKLLDGVVVSHREKVTKPDPAIFALLIERYGVHPENALFIDDSLPNVLAAETIGFQTWHYADADTLSETD